MLRNESIAARLQLTMDDLNSLLQGSVTAAVAAQLGMRQTDLQLFVEGQATDRIARELRMGTLDAACEFATSLGRDGAIGVLCGLLLCGPAVATDPIRPVRGECP